MSKNYVTKNRISGQFAWRTIEIGLDGETHTTSISASQRVECAPYVFSTDPRAVSALCTSEYRGRPYLIVNNDVRKKLAPSVGPGTASVDCGRHETDERHRFWTDRVGPSWPRSEPRSYWRVPLPSLAFVGCRWSDP